VALVVLLHELTLEHQPVLAIPVDNTTLFQDFLMLFDTALYLERNPAQLQSSVLEASH
jgi:hypothetical protein